MRAFSVPLCPFVLPLVRVVQGCKASKSRLHLLAIVTVDLPMEGPHQGLPVFGLDRFEDLVDTAIEPLHLPIGLGIERRYEAMFDVMYLAGLVEQVVARRRSKPYSEPISEAGCVVCQHVGYGEFEKANAMLQQPHDLFDTQSGVDTDGGQLGVPVEGHKKVVAYLVHFGQVLPVDVEIS